jgi:hypothetical protein
LKEEKLYPIVESFLRNDKECFITKRKTGTAIVGQVDVVGVRDVGGDLSGDIEIITVEVKEDIDSFGNSLGQALGYSIFGHKCYLAVKFKKRGFTSEQIQLANWLGVGLLKINNDNCEEVLTSQPHVPNNYHVLNILYNMGLVKCCICGTFVEKSGTKRLKTHLSDRKILFYGSGDKIKYNYLCKDCCKKLKLP